MYEGERERKFEMEDVLLGQRLGRTTDRLRQEGEEAQYKEIKGISSTMFSEDLDGVQGSPGYAGAVIEGRKCVTRKINREGARKRTREKWREKDLKKKKKTGASIQIMRKIYFFIRGGWGRRGRARRGALNTATYRWL